MPGLNDMPKIHEREIGCRRAEAILRNAVVKAISSPELMELTFFELLEVYELVFGGEVRALLRSALRMERHEDPNRPARWAAETPLPKRAPRVSDLIEGQERTLWCGICGTRCSADSRDYLLAADHEFICCDEPMVLGIFKETFEPVELKDPGNG